MKESREKKPLLELWGLPELKLADPQSVVRRINQLRIVQK
jgi:hypothetical protein